MDEMYIFLFDKLYTFDCDTTNTPNNKYNSNL